MELISSLCVSQNKTELVEISITCFLNQSYLNKELIFVYEDNNCFINDIKKKFIDKNIKFIECPAIPKKTLGELRNISINNSSGSILIQWDDDDVYHKERITTQYNFMIQKKTNAVMLDQRLFLMDNILYKTNIWPFEGSIMIKKNMFTDNKINPYSEDIKGEDTNILMDLLKTNSVEFMNCPNLYLYRYTGDNVWDKKHFNEIANSSYKLKNIDLSNKTIINEVNKMNATLMNQSQLHKKSLFNFLNKKFYEKKMKSKIKNLMILNTYKFNNTDEGLSVVYHSIKHLGIETPNTKYTRGKKVFVAGMCNMYVKLLNPKNINIIYTTYEFFPLPKRWINVLNAYYSVIIVPHIEIKKMFVNSGVKSPVYVVQQGCPERKFIEPKKNTGQKKFTIGFLGVPVARKNLELLIQAISLLKNRIPNIELKVHISKYYTELKKIDFPENDMFNISYGFKNDSEINEWYSSLDCYIFPSSGEGWSFTPRESLSLSIPTIVSNCPVHKDLSDYSCMVELPITVENIKQSILDVYNNKLKYKNLAIKGSEYVKTKNKNEDMIQSLKNLIEKL